MSNSGLLGFPKGAEQPSGLLGYPLGLADLGTPRLATYNQVGGSSFFENLTAPAGANTKPTAWTTVAASTDFAADGIYILLSVGSTQSPFLLDIAYCAAGAPDSSLTPVLENLAICGNGGGGGGSNIHPMGSTFIPAKIPANSRIAARVQCGTGSQTVRFALTIAGGGFYCLMSQYFREQMCSHVGVVTASSRGTSVDPGGSANAKGSWVELGRLEKPMRAMVVCVAQENSAPSTAFFQLDISRGSDREIIVPDYCVGAAIGTSNTGEGTQGDGLSNLIFCDLQAGDTLAARLRCSITDATDRLLNVSVVGFA